MIWLRASLSTFLVFVALTSIGQPDNSQKNETTYTSIKKKKIGHRKLQRYQAHDQITLLKNGALLVRLQTKNNLVTAFRESGNQSLALKIENKQRESNLKITSAFNTYFDFCPVYFFYSDHSQYVREKQFDEVNFLTANLDLDPTIKFNSTKFLTAEFGTIGPDTSKYFSHYTNEPEGDWNLNQVSNYYNSPGFGFGALIVKSDQFVQLRRPFPYYVRTFDTFPIKRSKKRTVKKMNKKLKRCYRRFY